MHKFVVKFAHLGGNGLEGETRPCFFVFSDDYSWELQCV